jgi:hypothetical protein
MLTIPNTNTTSQVLVLRNNVKTTMSVGVTMNVDRYLFIAAYHLMLRPFGTSILHAPSDALYMAKCDNIFNKGNVIPGFRRDVDDICALLGFYAA